jgi:uncharacterized protein YdiU (UPF0061 family)
LETEAAQDEFTNREAFSAWEDAWRARLDREGATPDARRALMETANPALIPRTHRIEAAIRAALAGDFAPFHALVDALSTPFAPPEDPSLTLPPQPEEVVAQTFCGT